MTIAIHSEQEIFKKTNSDTNGVYLQMVDSSELDLGDHAAKSKVASNGEISPYGKEFAFAVQNENIPTEPPGECSTKGDINKDCKVDLVDFSIVAFWFKKANPPVRVDLNNDKKVDLVDLSIMAFYWTG